MTVAIVKTAQKRNLLKASITIPTAITLSLTLVIYYNYLYAVGTVMCTTSFHPPLQRVLQNFKLGTRIQSREQLQRTAVATRKDHFSCHGELFWLARGTILVGQGSRIEATQNLPDVRFLDIRFLVLSFAYASTKRECNAVSTIADESWQYRRGGNLTILTKITTLQKQSSCSQACGFATITMYSWWQLGEIGCAYRI